MTINALGAVNFSPISTMSAAKQAPPAPPAVPAPPAPVTVDLGITPEESVDLRLLFQIVDLIRVANESLETYRDQRSESARRYIANASAAEVQPRCGENKRAGYRSVLKRAIIKYIKDELNFGIRNALDFNNNWLDFAGSESFTLEQELQKIDDLISKVEQAKTSNQDNAAVVAKLNDVLSMLRSLKIVLQADEHIKNLAGYIQASNTLWSNLSDEARTEIESMQTSGLTLHCGDDPPNRLTITEVLGKALFDIIKQFAAEHPELADDFPNFPAESPDEITEITAFADWINSVTLPVRLTIYEGTTRQVVDPAQPPPEMLEIEQGKQDYEVAIYGEYTDFPAGLAIEAYTIDPDTGDHVAVFQDKLTITIERVDATELRLKITVAQDLPVGEVHLVIPTGTWNRGSIDSSSVFSVTQEPQTAELVLKITSGLDEGCRDELLAEAEAVHQGATEEGAHWLNTMDSWLRKNMFGLNLQLSLGGLFSSGGGAGMVGAPEDSVALGLDLEAPFDIAQGKPYGLRIGPFLHLDYLAEFEGGSQDHALETGLAMQGGYHDGFDANYLLKLYYKGLMNEAPTMGYPNLHALGLSLSGTLGGAWSGESSHGIGSVMIAYDLLYGELNGRGLGSYIQNILRFAPLHIAVNDDALLSLGAAFRDDQYTGLLGGGLENMGLGVFGKLHLDVGGNVDLLFSGEGWFMQHYPNEWNVLAQILFPLGHTGVTMGLGAMASQRNTFLPGPTDYEPETTAQGQIDIWHIPLGQPTASGLDLFLDIGGQAGATNYPGHGWTPTGGLTFTFSLSREHEEIDEEEFPGAGNAAMMAADDLDDLDEAAYNHDFYQQKLIDAFKIGGLTAGYEYDPAVLSARLTAVHDFLMSQPSVYDGDHDGNFDMEDALLYYSHYQVDLIQDPEVTLGNVGYVRDSEILQVIDARRWLIEQGTAVDQQSGVTNLATALLSAVEVLVAHSNPTDPAKTDGTATNLADAHWFGEIEQYFVGTKEEFINCLKQELAGRVIGRAVAAVISYLRGEAVTTFTAGDAQLVLRTVADLTDQCEHLAAPPSPSI